MTDNSTPDEGQERRRRDDDSRPARRGDTPRGGRRSRPDDDQRGPRRGGGGRDDRGPRRGDRDDRRPRGDRPPRRDDERARRDDRQRAWGDRDDRRGPRRDDDRRGPRRDDDRRGPRRDDDRRGPRRDDDRRGPRRDDRQRSWGDRDDRRPRRGDDDRRFDREEREEKVHRPGTAPRADEPDTPTEFDEQQLHPGVRAELKGLPKDLADTVAAHIWAAGQLIDTDPELAHRHAEAARRRAGRLPIVREAAAETAYAAGEFATALREFRAIRRMTGSDELIPLIADCERALGKHRQALAVLEELGPRNRNVALQIEALLVEAGIRDDLGQRDEALRLLRTAISRKVGPPGAQARLHYALANLLEEGGDAEGARDWFSSAAELDKYGDLDTADRLAAIDGITLPDFDEDEADSLDAPTTEETDR